MRAPGILLGRRGGNPAAAAAFDAISSAASAWIAALQHGNLTTANFSIDATFRFPDRFG
jgi:hypothetical protein